MSIALVSCISTPPSTDNAASPDDADDAARDVGTTEDTSGDSRDAGGVMAEDASRRADADDARAADVGRTDEGSVDLGPARYRLPLTIPAGTVSEELTGFPLLVEIESAQVAELDVSGRDVAFSDSDEQSLPFELTTFSAAAGNVRAWVRVPRITADSETILYLTFDGAAANSRQVWSDYGAVWHFRPDPQAPAEFDDRTGNGNTAVARGTFDTGPGRVGPAIVMDGSDGWIRVESSPDLEPPNGSFSMWIRTAGSGSTLTPMSKPVNAGTGNSYQLWFDDAMAYGTVISATGGSSVAGAGNIAADEWQYLAMTFDGTTKVTYLNGDETHRVGVSGDIIYDGQPLVLGADINNGTVVYHFPGRIDEVRISPNLFSAARIEAEYANQSDPGAFVEVGTLEAY